MSGPQLPAGEGQAPGPEAATSGQSPPAAAAAQAPSPAESVAAQAERLVAESRAQLDAARALLDRERLRLHAMLAAPPPAPAPLPTGLAGGLAAIDRTLRSTMDYLAGHHAVPASADREREAT